MLIDPSGRPAAADIPATLDLGAVPPLVLLRGGEAAATVGRAVHRSRTQVGHLYERFVKRAIDLLGSIVLMVLVAPAMAAVALAVRLQLGSGVIFRQTRVGLKGRPFTVYKFRTMRPERRSSQVAFDGPDRRRTHKHPGDPRLTPVGRFLRKWSLDELPQLWNVARGDMSLVGPRPELVQIVNRYEPWQHGRHEVKPGLTGLWQVTARGDGPMHEHTDLDLEYTRRLGFVTDCMILLLTIPAVLGGRKGH